MPEVADNTSTETVDVPVAAPISASTDNEIVSKFKEKYPVYKDWNNDKLTEGIFKKFPQAYRDNPSYMTDVERIRFSKIAPAITATLDPPKVGMDSREGGVTDIARSASGQKLPEDVMLVPELSQAVPALAKGIADFLHAPFKLGQMATDAALNKVTGLNVQSEDPLTTAGKALNTASAAAGGLATDIATDKVNPIVGNFNFENTGAALRGEQQPDESRLAPYQKIYKGGAEMVPLLASAALLKGAGMSSSAAFGLPMYETTLQATGDPVAALTQGAVGALLGPVNESGHAGGEMLASRIAVALKLPENATIPVLQAGKVIGSQSLMNALMLSSQSPELLQEMQTNPDAALSRIYHTVGMNLAFEVPHIPEQARNALAKDLVTEYFKGGEYKQGVDAIVRGGMRPTEFPTKVTVQTPEAQRAIALAQDSHLPATAQVLEQISGREEISNEEVQKQKEVPVVPNSGAVAEAIPMTEGTVVKPAEATAPEPTEPIPGEKLMTVQRPDGTTYKVSFSDKYWDDEKTMPSVARLTPEGQWSHGMLKKGEKFVEESKAPEPPKAVEPVGTTKEPWQMTRDEYHVYNAESIIADYESGGSERRGYGATEKLKPMSDADKADIRSDREFSDRNRKSTIESALREGKPVPPEVLADYPDLAKQSKTAAPEKYDLQQIGATSGEWKTVQTYGSKADAEKALPKGSGWRLVKSEKPIEPEFIQSAKRTPSNTSKWPKFPKKEGYEVVFKPYGPEGSGYYYEPIKSPIRQNIDVSNDKFIGQNAAGEKLYERADGSTYRMRNDRKDRPNGYPDFGGDLAQVSPSEKPLKIGDPIRVMGVDSVLAKTETIDGMRYELFNGAKLSENKATIRVTDLDSGKVSTLKQHSNYDGAESEYNKSIEAAKSSSEKWESVEVGRFKDESSAEKEMEKNVNNRSYRKVGNDYVVFEDRPISENVSTTKPATGSVSTSGGERAGANDISATETTNKGATDETSKSTTEGNGTVQSNAEKANADAKARETGHADEQAQVSSIGDEGVRTATERVVSALESLKFDQSMGSTRTNLLKDIPVAIWNGAVDAAILAVKAGGGIAHAMTAAVKYVQENHKQQFDEAAVADRIRAAFKNAPEPTSTKNQVTQAERAARGMPSVQNVERGDPKAQAEQILKDDPAAGGKIVRDIIDTPNTPVNDVQQEVLLAHKSNLRANITAESDRMVDQKLTEQERETARKNLAELLDEHNRLDQATKNAGKTWSDTGRLRQQVIQEDYSFPTVVAKARFAKGEDLTREEIDKLKKQSDAWEAKQAEIDEAQAEASEKQREQHGEDAKTDVVTTVTGEKGKEVSPSFAPHIIAAAEAFVKRANVRADTAWKRLQSSGIKFGSGSGFEHLANIRDMVIIGSAKVAEGALSVAKLADAMAAHVGEWVRPHITDEFLEASKKLSEEDTKRELGGNSKKVRRVMAKEKPEGARDLATERTSIVEGLKDAVKDETDKPDIGRYARKIAENFLASEVEKGRAAADVKGEEIDAAVHDVLKEVVPDITPVESRDAWTQYGKYKPATTEPVRQRLIQASNEQRKISTLERLQKGLQGLRSGQQRVPDTDYSRRLTKQINQLNKELGIVTKDPAAQLKSTLDAIKTRNKNRIADLRYENSTGKRIVKEKGVSPSDAETIAQRAEIEKLKAENEAIFGDKELTDEQRLQRAINASERAESDAEAQLTRAEKGDFGKDASGKPLPASGKLDEIKARTAAMREQTKLLRDLDTNFQEQKRVKEQTAQLEEVDKRIEEVTRQINEGDVAAKTPADKLVIPELAQKRAELAELNKIKAKLQAAEKAKTPAEREAAKVTAVQERIDEVGRQINEGDIAARKRGVSTASPERVSLQEELKELNKIKAKLRAAEKASTAAEREAKTNEALQERINEVVRQINEGDIAPKPTTPKPVAASTEALRGELADLNKARQELRNAAKPKKTPEEIALQSAKTRITNTINDIKMRSYRLGLGDASAAMPKPRRTVTPDAALIRLQTQKADIQRQFQKQLLEYKLKQRTPIQRAGDLLLRINREFAISGLSALFVKLPSYSAFRFAERPLHEVVALGLSKLPGIRDVAARAPSEVSRGGIGEVKAMAKDYANAVVKGVRDAKDSWVDESELKKRYDPHIRPDEAEFRTFFGRLHQMEKSPLIRFTWERSFRRRLDFAAEHGEDITDPTVLQKHGELAYADALNEALVNRNALVSKVTRFVESLAEKDKVTGRESGLGKAAKFAFQLENPVLHVPLNYVARTAEYVFGGVYGLGETAVALRRGIETLGPEEANQIMRHLTKGAIGNAAILTGFLLPQMFGGFWSPTRDKKQEMKPGEFKTPIGTAPKSAGHNQLINAMQFGATMRQISESKLRKSDTEAAGLSVGAQAAFWGLVDETPYAREMSDYVRVRDPRQSGKYWSEKAKNKLVPQAVQQMAEFFDKSNGEVIKRDPKGALQTIQSGIPYLRNQLPEKIDKARAR